MEKFKAYTTLALLATAFAISLRGWYEFMKEYGQWLTSLKKN